MGYSRQRELLLAVLRDTRSHPTATDIYDEMRRRKSKVSLGTVYRNLAMLTETGEILRIDTDQDSVHYDGFTHPHYHFVCKECGKVSDLSISPLSMEAEVEKETGGVVAGHTLLFYGKCKNCI